MDQQNCQSESNQIELLAIQCRRDSMTRIGGGRATSSDCFSFLVGFICPSKWEPEWVFLPGLYLLDDDQEVVRRVSVRSDDESFAILAHSPIPVEPAMSLHRFALLTFNDDGELVKGEIWSEPGNDEPTVIQRGQSELIERFVKAF